MATSCEELTHWKRLWCWEGLGAGGEGDDRGWDGWMASLTWWMWVWVNSGSWWCTGRPGVLRFMGSQRVRHDWVTDLIWSDNEKNIFLEVLVLEGLLGLHRTVQLQLLQHYWSEHRLGLLWYWMIRLGNKQRSFCHLGDCIQVLHFGLFCWLHDGYSISSKVPCPQ